jgi:DNA-binding Lrp family transcriptional regulator
MGMKEKRKKDIDVKIFGLLGKENKPISTREIAVKTKLSWHTVINHCLRLQLSGKISGYKISNLNVWLLKEKEERK